jgi:hypothetical protein
MDCPDFLNLLRHESDARVAFDHDDRPISIQSPLYVKTIENLLAIKIQMASLKLALFLG